jgi:hypothetical protein
MASSVTAPPAIVPLTIRTRLARTMQHPPVWAQGTGARTRPSDSPMRTNPPPLVAIGLVVVVTLAAGCAQGSGRPESDGPLASRNQPIPLRSSDALPSGAGTGDVPDAILSAILADAAERTGAGTEEIAVTRGEAVTWNDGSLGCPEPDTSYTQALVDGYHVVLDVDGETLDYRVGSGADFRLCDSPIEGGG